MVNIAPGRVFQPDTAAPQPSLTQMLNAPGASKGRGPDDELTVNMKKANAHLEKIGKAVSQPASKITPEKKERLGYKNIVDELKKVSEGIGELIEVTETIASSMGGHGGSSHSPSAAVATPGTPKKGFFSSLFGPKKTKVYDPAAEEEAASRVGAPRSGPKIVKHDAEITKEATKGNDLSPKHAEKEGKSEAGGSSEPSSLLADIKTILNCILNMDIAKSLDERKKDVHDKEIAKSTEKEGKGKDGVAKKEGGGKGILGALLGGLGALAMNPAGMGKMIGGKIMSGVASLFKGVFSFLLKSIGRIAGSLLKSLGSGIGGIFKGLFKFLKIGLKALPIVGWLITLGMGLFGGITDAIAKYKETGDIMKTIWAFVKGFIKSISFGLIDDKMLDDIGETVSKFFKEYVVDPFMSMWDDLSKTFEKIWNVASDGIDDGIKIVKRLLEDGVDSYINMYKHLFNGIKFVLGTILKTIADFELPSFEVGGKKFGGYKPFASIIGGAGDGLIQSSADSEKEMKEAAEAKHASRAKEDSDTLASRAARDAALENTSKGGGDQSAKTSDLATSGTPKTIVVQAPAPQAAPQQAPASGGGGSAGIVNVETRGQQDSRMDPNRFRG